jgi:hypothetical protein
LDAAREEAEESARQITNDRLLFGELVEDEAFVVTDEQNGSYLPIKGRCPRLSAPPRSNNR